MSRRVRIAASQYFLRPIASFEDFEAQAGAWIEAAKDYRCRLVLFPEYFTAQLLSLGDPRRPLREQIEGLANLEGRFVEFFRSQAKRHGLTVVAGTIPSWGGGKSRLVNRCHVFGPSGSESFQDKLQMTRFESEEWDVRSGHGLRLFESDFGKFAVNICYDVEFPEFAREAARQGAELLLVPSCTDDRRGFLRVRYCAAARAIENQLYVVHSGTVGSIASLPAAALNYGQAAFLTPCDYPFARDGILTEGVTNEESLVVGEFDLALISECRTSGTVLPLRDSAKTANLFGPIEFVALP